MTLRRLFLVLITLLFWVAACDNGTNPPDPSVSDPIPATVVLDFANYRGTQATLPAGMSVTGPPRVPCFFLSILIPRLIPLPVSLYHTM